MLMNYIRREGDRYNYSVSMDKVIDIPDDLKNGLYWVVVDIFLGGSGYYVVPFKRGF